MNTVCFDSGSGCDNAVISQIRNEGGILTIEKSLQYKTNARNSGKLRDYQTKLDSIARETVKEFVSNGKSDKTFIFGCQQDMDFFKGRIDYHSKQFGVYFDVSLKKTLTTKNK